MKVFEINDQWTNNEETLKQLWRVQGAKTYEFFIYFHDLIKKYKLWMPPSVWTKLETLQTAESTELRGKGIVLRSVFQSCTPEEKVKGKAKFHRMFNAKQNYEWARQKDREKLK